MTVNELNQGRALQENIDLITTLQAAAGTAGAKAFVIVVTDDEQKTLINAEQLKDALGDATYDTICAATLASINSELADKKADSQTALTAL